MTTANRFDNTRNPVRDHDKTSKSAAPLAMGTGFIDPNRALDPGLIYDIGRQNYVNLLRPLHFSANELFAITKSDNLDCSSPYY